MGRPSTRGASLTMMYEPQFMHVSICLRYWSHIWVMCVPPQGRGVEQAIHFDQIIQSARSLGKRQLRCTHTAIRNCSSCLCVRYTPQDVAIHQWKHHCLSIEVLPAAVALLQVVPTLGFQLEAIVPSALSPVALRWVGTCGFRLVRNPSAGIPCLPA